MPGAYQRVVNRTWNYNRIDANLRGHHNWPDKDKAAEIAEAVDILIGGELARMEQETVTRLEAIESGINELTGIAKEILVELRKMNNSQRLKI